MFRPKIKKSIIPASVLGSVVLLSFGVIAHSQMYGMGGQAPGIVPGSSPSPSGSPSSAPSANPISATNLGDERQIYDVQLQPLNASQGQAGSLASGSARIIVDGDRIGVVLNANGLFPGIPHMAHIHMGTTCPTFSADTNGDGYVDVIEGLPSYGPILVNLDSDLSSFDAGSATMTYSDSNGIMDYIGSGSFSSLMADLQRPAPNPATGVGVLSRGQTLDLSSAVIVVHGIDPSVVLPPSVQTVIPLSGNQSLPVACGKLVQTSGPQSSASPSPSPSPSASPSPSSSPSPSPSPSASPSASPSPSSSPSPSASPSP